MTKLYFILGCTAGGKGAVGRHLAARLGAGIISVDSMKVYRRMDIGTAKPSAQIRAEIPHYCVDVVEPSEGFSVAQFLDCADAAAEDITAAGQIPLAVGGASLYIKALTEGLFEAPPALPQLRKELTERANALGLAKLHEQLRQVDPAAAKRIHPNDEKRIIRALEVYESAGRPISDLQRQWDTGRRRCDCVLIGLRRNKTDLSRRINLRVKRMIDAGLRDEVAALLDEDKPLSPQAAQAVGYAEMIEHFTGRCDLDTAVERIKINTRKLAKKQRTWHRRFDGVLWFDLAEDEPAEKTADRILSQVQFE